jgi:hypothetical protein
VKPMTEFGGVVWALAAKRGIVSQRDLSRLIEERTGEKVSFDQISYFLYGRTVVHPSFPRQLVATLDLSEEERLELAHAFAFGQDVEFTPAGL